VKTDSLPVEMHLIMKQQLQI